VTPLPVDPTAIRAALERQLVLLAPVREHLRAASLAPAVERTAGWRGPAAEAAATRDDELRSRIRRAADAVDDRIRELRVAIAVLT
jgi:hypothetical protein